MPKQVGNTALDYDDAETAQLATEPRAPPQEVERAITRAEVVQEGTALAVLDVMPLARKPFPALRGVLFTRERGGLHQGRAAGAVAALAALGASDVLIDFLETERLGTIQSSVRVRMP